MWLSVSDPLEASPVDDTATNTAELYVDDVLVSSTTETLTANHAGAATVLIGEGAFTAVAGVYHYDDVALTHDGSNLLGNAGFESALAGTGTSRVVTSGNWRVYDPGASTVSIVASPTHTGSGALHGNITSGNGNGCYAFQDATLPEGDAFELELWVYPTSGVQDAQVLFDWSNRGGTAGSAVQSLSIAWSASAVTATVLGVALPASDPLPVGEWSKVRLVVAAQEVA